MVRVRVEVRLKKGVTDPEGDNVHKALTLLGFKGLRAVHTSKLFLVISFTTPRHSVHMFVCLLMMGIIQVPKGMVLVE